MTKGDGVISLSNGDGDSGKSPLGLFNTEGIFMGEGRWQILPQWLMVEREIDKNTTVWHVLENIPFE